MIDTPSPVAELTRELKTLRQEITALRTTIEQSGALRSLVPAFNAASSQEFLTLFQAHRGLSDRVSALEKLITDRNQ